jgi:O-antigen ligase
MSCAMVSLIFLYGFKIGFDPIIERFLQISEDNSRIDIWRDSLVIVKDHPLGIGLGNFKDVFPVYNASNISDTRYLYAHNDYLHLLIEAGIPGFLALVSGFLFFLALSGLVSLAFHSFFDFNLHMPSNLIYFVTLMAIVHSCAWSEAHPYKSKVKVKNQQAGKLMSC